MIQGSLDITSPTKARSLKIQTGIQMSYQFAGLMVMHVLCAPPYPESEAITDIALDWSTHQRFAQGSDNFQLTWADDDNLYGAWGDGGGFGGTNRLGRVGLGVARIEGPSSAYKGFNVWGGNSPENAATFDGKSWGMIGVDGTLYMWVVPDNPRERDIGTTTSTSNWPVPPIAPRHGQRPIGGSWSRKI